jgi:peroxiredoxin Q/BCP
MLQEDKPAPEFTLENQDGDPVSLSDFEGQYVVVYFYPQADTRGCTIEAEGFRDNWSAYEDADVTVLGISNDPVEDLADFKEKYDLPFDLLSDEDGAVAQRYESYGTVDVRGEEAEIAFRNTYVVGPDGAIVAVYEDVDPEGHADRVLEDIPA